MFNEKSLLRLLIKYKTSTLSRYENAWIYLPNIHRNNFKKFSKFWKLTCGATTLHKFKVPRENSTAETRKMALYRGNGLRLGSPFNSSPHRVAPSFITASYRKTRVGIAWGPESHQSPFAIHVLPLSALPTSAAFHESFLSELSLGALNIYIHSMVGWGKIFPFTQHFRVIFVTSSILKRYNLTDTSHIMINHYFF